MNPRNACALAGLANQCIRPLCYCSMREWAHRDSNPEPSGYEPLALTVAPCAHTSPVEAGEGTTSTLVDKLIYAECRHYCIPCAVTSLDIRVQSVVRVVLRTESPTTMCVLTLAGWAVGRFRVDKWLKNFGDYAAVSRTVGGMDCSMSAAGAYVMMFCCLSVGLSPALSSACISESVHHTDVDNLIAATVPYVTMTRSSATCHLRFPSCLE